MDEKHRMHMRMSQFKFSKTLSANDLLELLPLLSQSQFNLLPSAARQEIEGQYSHEAKVTKMMDRVSKRGAEAFFNFIRALQQLGSPTSLQCAQHLQGLVQQENNDGVTIPTDRSATKYSVTRETAHVLLLSLDGYQNTEDIHLLHQHFSTFVTNCELVQLSNDHNALEEVERFLDKVPKHASFVGLVVASSGTYDLVHLANSNAPFLHKLEFSHTLCREQWRQCAKLVMFLTRTSHQLLDTAGTFRKPPETPSIQPTDMFELDFTVLQSHEHGSAPTPFVQLLMNSCKNNVPLVHAVAMANWHLQRRAYVRGDDEIPVAKLVFHSNMKLILNHAN